MNIKTIATVTLACALAGCGNSPPPPPTYDNNAYAAAVCVDQAWVRVPDDYCPLGDGIVEGHPYFWVYDEYTPQEVDIDIVFVGYPVERTRYVNTRPPRVATTNIDRGRFPDKALPGQTGTSQRLPNLPTDRRAPSSNVTRGGLGVQQRPTAAVPTPVRGTNSPAPGRAAAAPTKAATAEKAAPPPRANPPRVSGSRPLGSSTRSGRR